MKRKIKTYITIIIFITVINIIFLTPIAAWAVSPTPSKTISPTKVSTPSATIEEEQKSIQKIKEMVANKVAKLKLVEKRGILGTVKEVSNSQITVFDQTNRIRFIDIDELTKFQESIGSSKTFGISDIKAGDILGFVGTYNKDTRRLLARFVTKTTSIPKHYTGIITGVNLKDFSFTIYTTEGTKKTIDVETSTKTRGYSAGDDDIQKSGFSKMKIGERILVVGFDSEDEKDRVSASRILHFTDLLPSKDLLENLPKDEDKATDLKISPTKKTTQ